MTERAYLDLLNDIMDNGVDREDRTGTGTRGVFGRQIRFDLSKGFPLLTTKKVFLRGIIEELLWFLRGSTNAKELEDKNVNIWKSWGDPDTRELGPVYGKQWRKWESPSKDQVPAMMENGRGTAALVEHTDQISDLIERLKTDPNSRRHMVVAWNPGEISRMALPPCHCLFQFFVEPLSKEEIYQTYFGYRDTFAVRDSKEYKMRSARVDEVTEAEGRTKTLDDLAALGLPTQKLSCQLYQRSADIFLGVPFNIASYALLTMMVAKQVGMVPGDFVHTFGDVHLYSNHVEQATEQLTREPFAFPHMGINPNVPDIFSYTIDDFELFNYNCHPAIKAPVAV